MHYARENWPRQHGYRHFGRIRAVVELVFHILHFHFQTKSNTENAIISSASNTHLQ